jgi:quercetin dioxygenase-like cupin family protein
MSTTLTLNGSETLKVRESTPERFEVEATYAPRGERPPKHVHPHHDEAFTVLSGTIRVGLRDGERDFTAGESFEITRGVVHHMWNPGEEATTVRWVSAPAMRVESFFRAMDRLQRTGKPRMIDQARVLNGYQDVIRPASAIARALVRVVGPMRAA